MIKSGMTPKKTEVRTLSMESTLARNLGKSNLGKSNKSSRKKSIGSTLRSNPKSFQSLTKKSPMKTYNTIDLSQLEGQLRQVNAIRSFASTGIVDSTDADNDDWGEESSSPVHFPHKEMLSGLNLSEKEGENDPLEQSKTTCSKQNQIDHWKELEEAKPLGWKTSISSNTEDMRSIEILKWKENNDEESNFDNCFEAKLLKDTFNTAVDNNNNNIGHLTLAFSTDSNTNHVQELNGCGPKDDDQLHPLYPNCVNKSTLGMDGNLNESNGQEKVNDQNFVFNRTTDKWEGNDIDMTDFDSETDKDDSKKEPSSFDTFETFDASDASSSSCSPPLPIPAPPPSVLKETDHDPTNVISSVKPTKMEQNTNNIGRRPRAESANSLIGRTRFSSEQDFVITADMRKAFEISERAHSQLLKCWKQSGNDIHDGYSSLLPSSRTHSKWKSSPFVGVAAANSKTIQRPPISSTRTNTNTSHESKLRGTFLNADLNSSLDPMHRDLLKETRMMSIERIVEDAKRLRMFEKKYPVDDLSTFHGNGHDKLINDHGTNGNAKLSGNGKYGKYRKLGNGSNARNNLNYM